MTFNLNFDKSLFDIFADYKGVRWANVIDSWIESEGLHEEARQRNPLFLQQVKTDNVITHKP